MDNSTNKINYHFYLFVNIYINSKDHFTHFTLINRLQMTHVHFKLNKLTQCYYYNESLCLIVIHLFDNL